jgi:hypothetical protein
MMARTRPCAGILGRQYRGHNSIDDMMSASEAWHSVVPDRRLGDERSLREAFDKLDLSGSGKIGKFEYACIALLDHCASAA